MTRKELIAIVLATTLAALGGLPGCDDGGEETEDPGEHACEKVDVTPTAVEASVACDETAPLVEISGSPYVAALPEGDQGYVRLEVGGDTAVLVFTRDANVLASLHHDGAEEDVTSAGADGFCADDIQEHFHLDLHQAGTYYLELGPTASDEAWFLLSSAEGHVYEE